MTIVLVLGVLGALVAPHLVDLDRARPAVAATVWSCALALRALTALFFVVVVLFYVPTTTLFAMVTHWCWHTVLPVLADHIPVDGHLVGDLALVVPAFAVAASLSWVLFGMWRGARAVRRFLKRHAIDGGPQASVIVGDREVLLAAAGLRRPQVVVSAGALMSLDDDELAAGLAHERGHIAHRHRWVLALGCALAAIGRFVPGTRHALAELELHLERDADAFALRQHDKLALASAICKTAAGQTALPRPAMGLAGGRFRRRMALLLEQDPLSRAERGPRALAAIMLAVVVAATASVPASAAQGLDAPSGPSLEHCMT